MSDRQEPPHEDEPTARVDNNNAAPDAPGPEPRTRENYWASRGIQPRSPSVHNDMAPRRESTPWEPSNISSPDTAPVLQGRGRWIAVIVVLALVIGGAAIVLKGSHGPGVEHGSTITAAADTTSSCTVYACDENVLQAISCPVDSYCVAVGEHFNLSPKGYTNTETLVEEWNGSAWSVVPSPSPATGQTSLLSVSCTSQSFCIAVGKTVLTGGYTKLIERWNGASWSIVNTGPAPYSILDGVSCSSAVRCLAVGNSAPGGGHIGTLIEQWNGTTWSTMSSPTINETDGLVFLGFDAVGCVGRSTCFALGHHFVDNYEHTLVERWNGAKWQIVTSANPGKGDNVQTGLSCANARLCFATGSYNGDPFSTSTAHTFIERWNGASWTRVAAPNGSGPYDILNGVSCASTTLCFAVGNQETSTTSEGMVERWNGDSWSEIKSPFITGTVAGFVELNGVSCVSATTCFAVGKFPNEMGTGRSLIEQWNGSTWSFVDAPNFSG
ncbi:MAG: hypothetical protein ABSE75_00805 [Acidimicrobiales bacterium]